MTKNKIIIILFIFLILVSGAFFMVFQGASNQETTELSTSKRDQEENLEPNKEEKEEVVVKNMVYASTSRLAIHLQADETSEIMDKLIKGTAVEVLEEKEIITEIQNENQEENGEENNTNKVNWLKVLYKSPQEDITGWILADSVTKDRKDVLGDNLKDLDYSPQNKNQEYSSNPPQEVKGIYLTLYSASNSRLDQLIEMAKRTEINAFVIDVKDDNGHMLFESKAAEKYSPDANKNAPVKDIKALIKKLHDNDIYVIARIVSFKDPTYAKHHPDRAIVYKDSNKPYTNSDGLIWVSPHDRELWEYNIEVSKEAAEAGFNEIQFDYVRFPASNGGKLDKQLNYKNTTGESKPGTIQNYLKQAYASLSPQEVYISADIYGLVGSVGDDMALGQYWEAISNVVDYVSPMMYPSHYANGTYGLSVPDAYPYETIFHSTKDSLIRNNNIETPAIIRPWIQDFTASWVKGHIPYGTKQLQEQIKALEDNGVKEYLLWNAGNKYSEDALK